jgi:sulfonate transport system permease protein
VKRRYKNAALQMWLPITLFVAWYVLSDDSTSPFFPPLAKIIDGFRENWLFARVGIELVPSVVRFLAGFFLAVLLGVAAGLLVGLQPTLRRATQPTVDFLRSVPVTTLVSAFIVILGFGHTMNIAFITWAAFFPVLLNTIDGVRAMDPTQRDMARTYRISLRDRIFHVVLPAASPQIFTGARVALAVALLVMAFGEMVSGTSGLGFFILFAQNTFRVVDMWSGIVLLGLLGYVVNSIFVAVERRALAWHRGWRASILDGVGG